jgi:regulatory protein
MPQFVQHLTKEQALQKLKHFCGYRERSHHEVVEKLYALGVWKKDHDEILATLIEEDYLNEQRFANTFARGHFRQKQWGKIKIRYQLRQKKVSTYCINSAMKEIDDEEYAATLQQLFDAKWNSLKNEKNRFVKMKKVSDYLVQKGYEPEIVNNLMKG